MAFDLHNPETWDAGAELDAAVAEHVMGEARPNSEPARTLQGQRHGLWYWNVMGQKWVVSPSLSTCWDSGAKLVVERLFQEPGASLFLDFYNGAWCADYHNNDSSSANQSNASGIENLPLAVCRVALKWALKEG